MSEEKVEDSRAGAWTAYKRMSGFVPWSMFVEDVTANASRPKEVYFFHSGNPPPEGEPPGPVKVTIFACTDHDMRCSISRIINGHHGRGYGHCPVNMWPDIARELRRFENYPVLLELMEETIRLCALYGAEVESDKFNAFRDSVERATLQQ